MFKKFIASVCVALFSTMSFAGANDYFIYKIDPWDTGSFPWLLSLPASSASAMFYLDGPSGNVQFIALGTGCSVTSNTLNCFDGTGYVTSSALATALAGKFNNPTGTTAQYIMGNGVINNFPTNVSFFSNDAGYVTQSGARSAISLTTTGSGAASYNSSTGVLNVPTPTATGTVTSVGISTSTLSVSGSPVTSSGNITVNLPNTGTAGTYQYVTTDAQGRVTAGANNSINDSPGRSLVTTTSSTGFQISATRPVRVCYEGSFSTTSTIGGPSGASVFLETADTNSTTPGDWTTKAVQTYSNTITLAIVLNQVQANNWSMCRDIPAGKYVRIRSGSITGTASVSLNAQQQETTM